MTAHALMFPIGEFEKPVKITRKHITQWIEDLASFPNRLREQVDGLSAFQLGLQYRENSWTVQQVIHHCADSHMNAFTRIKLALTEDNPTILPYDEAKWAEIADAKSASIEWSLQLLTGLHARLVHLLESLTDEQFQRTFVHPDRKEPVTLAEQTGIYAWHSNHHLAHVMQAQLRYELRDLDAQDA